MKLLLTLAVAVGVAGCGRTTGDAAERSANDSATGSSGDPTREVVLSAAAIQHGGVRWSPAVARDIAATTEVPGQLVPNEDRTSRLGAPARGRVVAVHVQLGNYVAQGARLVTLQSAEATSARADYDKAVADLAARRAGATYARTARERAERLLVAKAIARQELERAQADDELAKSELARAEAEVARTRSTVDQLGVNVETGAMVLRAPVAGVVLSREAVPGAVVEAGAPLVTVSDLRTLWLDVAVTDRAASGLRAGSRVHFVVPAFPADTFDARVVSVGGALDPQTRTIPVRSLVENPRRRLRAQMFATVWLEGSDGGAPRQVATVPESAVMLLDERPVVFVARPSAEGSTVAAVRFERRDVEVGGSVGGMVPILRGVLPGELVVTDGAFAVKSEFSRSKMPED